MQGWIKEEGREYKDKWKGWKEGVDEKLDETMNGKRSVWLKKGWRFKDAFTNESEEGNKEWMYERVNEWNDKRKKSLF